MTRQLLNCERCAQFSRELLELEQQVQAASTRELRNQRVGGVAQSVINFPVASVVARPFVRLLHGLGSSLGRPVQLDTPAE